jgi:3-oxoacyl-[acyl-carrier protein] reductase
VPVSDRYQRITTSRLGGPIAKRVGLPVPPELERYEPGQPVVSGPVLLGAAPGGRLARTVAEVLSRVGAETHTALQEELRTAAADADLYAHVWNADAGSEQRFKALVFDATGVASSDELGQLHAFFHPTIRRVQRSGRIIVLGTPPEGCERPREATAQRALEGLTRSMGKEVRQGGTAQLVYVAPGAEEAVESTLRFFLSPKSAYVSGQVVRVTPAEVPAEVDWERPLDGRIALVTGASRGIGEAIATTLARDGAQVVGLDVPDLEDELRTVTDRIDGVALPLDISADDAPARIGDHLTRQGGVDVVVHNAGVTRDRTLGRMDEAGWSMVIDINLRAPERINEELLARELFREHGRIVAVSSVSGIAGNAGQTNYATSKAGVIGMVQSLAPLLAERSITINAVAPGFIETQMTAAMPLTPREAGRRMNSMSQGGLPVDVAEAIAWYASPGSAGVNGNVVRVCGQALIGA